MALYAIGDLHLSFGVNKPMDVFGGAWDGYVDKLREGLKVIGPEDTTVLLGDLTWGIDLQQAREDFAFINSIPGRKLILKGNHDYWWTTAAKFYKFCEENGFTNMYILNNNFYEYEELALCGTRGWFFEEDAALGSHNDKIFKRELIRLETSLKAAGDRVKLCFLHYPPRYRGYECPEILRLLKDYGVRQCCYGHLHGDSHKLAIEGLHDGVDFRLCAADFVKFSPIRLR
ncbi:MAG: serine/threonine protein phosphatase [Ruminococcaceae bacterium]|nr:serine/threonine protein phosphatase [Oscillospiraceae bacterium]